MEPSEKDPAFLTTVEKDNIEFGNLAVALDFLSAQDLQRALKRQEDFRRVGEERRLGEILYRMRLLSREQILLVLRAQGKRILTCAKCRKSYNVKHYKGDETYTCKHCGGALTIPAKPVKTAVHDTAVVDPTVPLPPAKKNGNEVPPKLVKLLPGYELVKQLGRGGMGTVYKARDTILDRWVAVKILAPFLAENEEYVKRFIREARMLQRLRHPNIVAAFDAGQEWDYHFFIMEYVRGAPLDNVIKKKGKLLERKALRIVRQAAEGLQFAWEHRIVHRDVKPQNLMITEDRVVKILDLGLSKSVDTDISLTVTGSILCSPAYASPEQAQGVHDLTFKTDVYSLGCSLFQMVTGRLPFEAETPAEFILQHVTKDPPHPLAVNPSLSADMGKLIMKMMEKDPERRPEWQKVILACDRLLEFRGTSSTRRIPKQA